MVNGTRWRGRYRCRVGSGRGIPADQLACVGHPEEIACYCAILADRSRVKNPPRAVPRGLCGPAVTTLDIASLCSTSIDTLRRKVYARTWLMKLMTRPLQNGSMTGAVLSSAQCGILGLRLPAARFRDAAMRRSIRGFHGRVVYLTFGPPVARAVSRFVDADHDNHLRRRRADRDRRQCGHRPGAADKFLNQFHPTFDVRFDPRGYRRIVQGARHALERADRPPRRGALYAHRISTVDGRPTKPKFASCWLKVANYVEHKQ